ncbi:MAG: preprotein translocase subunit SecG [Candidatus Doudnabacteria bacterium]|nr:preprotein translocase subunit SecG [bacterium]MDZ4244028.1 preprotein translocase subunit SecG [Candidatus Doudnabacteria bacterium]
MEKVIFFSQITVSVLLVIAILLQNRGSGLSAVFGGGGNIYRTKRGLEKGLFSLTIILVILFVAIGIANLYIS